MSQVRSVTYVSGLDTGQFGAARGIRTPDPVITNDVLYRLSYCGGPCSSRAQRDGPKTRAHLISGTAPIGKKKGRHLGHDPEKHALGAMTRWMGTGFPKDHAPNNWVRPVSRPSGTGIPASRRLAPSACRFARRIHRSAPRHRSRDRPARAESGSRPAPALLPAWRDPGGNGTTAPGPRLAVRAAAMTAGAPLALMGPAGTGPGAAWPAGERALAKRPVRPPVPPWRPAANCPARRAPDSPRRGAGPAAPARARRA